MIVTEKFFVYPSFCLHLEVARKDIVKTIRQKHMQSLREYLEEKGLLIDLNDSQLSIQEKELWQQKIMDAKSVYRKMYLKEKKKEYRATKARAEITLSKKGRSSEYDLVKKRAKGKKLGSFIKECALAYLRGEYVVPNDEIIDSLIQQIAQFRQERNKEGRNIKYLLDNANNRGIVVEHDIRELQNKMYSLEALDFTFHLEEKVIAALRYPEQQFTSYLQKKLEEQPELIQEVEQILELIKSKQDGD